MKDCFFHIEKDGKILLSNLPKDLVAFAASCPFDRNVSICPVRNKLRRWKKVAIESGSVYMCTYDESVTRRIFDHYFDALMILQSSFNIRLQEMVQANTTSLRRLQHNVNTYNAKIQDDVEEWVELEDISEKDWMKITEWVEKSVAGNTRQVAITLLKIAKNVALVNAEMDVYDYLQNSKGILDFQQHLIHKVVKLSLQPFFLDFLEKGITIEFGICKDYVMIDFASVTVILGHFWNNAVKYAANNTQITIEYSSQKDSVFMRVSMTSLQITDEDFENLFEEGYSGYWAKVQSTDGSGIGMYYVKHLMNINKGGFTIERGKSNFQINGIPFASNSFIFEFKKEIAE